MVAVKPVPVRVAVKLEIVGAVALMRIRCVGTGVGVMSVENELSRAVMVTVPATVPDWMAMLGVVVDPAGIVTWRVRPPCWNCTAGSSAPVSGAKVSVSITLTFPG